MSERTHDEVVGWVLGPVLDNSKAAPTVIGYTADMEIVAVSYVVLPHLPLADYFH